MAKFGENYGGQNGHISCPMCFLHLDNQPMAFQCLEVKKEVTIKGKYEDLFDNSITPDVVMTICNIMKIRNKFEQEKYLEMSYNKQELHIWRRIASVRPHCALSS